MSSATAAYIPRCAKARIRKYATTPPAPSQPTCVEAEYVRGGSLAYLAVWDVHRAKLFGRCEQTTGIDPFDRLVDQVMTAEPYATARQVFWVVEYGSSHRGQASIDRERDRALAVRPPRCARRWPRWPSGPRGELEPRGIPGGVPAT